MAPPCASAPAPPGGGRSGKKPPWTRYQISPQAERSRSAFQIRLVARLPCRLFLRGHLALILPVPRRLICQPVKPGGGGTLVRKLPSPGSSHDLIVRAVFRLGRAGIGPGRVENNILVFVLEPFRPARLDEGVEIAAPGRAGDELVEVFGERPE